MRLIDADALIEEIAKWLYSEDEQRDKVEIEDIAGCVIETIKEQPTVDNFVKAVNISKDGRTFDALLDKQRMLIYRSAITYEMAISMGYEICEVR